MSTRTEIGGTLGTILLDRETYERVKYGGSRDTGTGDWFAVSIKPWQCGGCKRDIRYVTAPGDGHPIVVWPSVDDPNLLRVVREQEANEVPVPYEKSMGECVSYYQLTPS